MKFGRSWLPAHVFAWLYAVLLAAPLYYLLVSAFKSNDEIFGSPFSLPTSFSFGNFGEAFGSAHLGQAMVNSGLVTVVALALTLALAIPAAFALARAEGRAGAWVERVFSLGFLVPTFAALFPTFLLAAATGLFHTRAFMVLFLPATAMPLSVVILVQFMRTIPREMEEAARMDGASTFAVLRHVYTPMCLPGIATILLLNFLTFWNEYLYSLVIIGPDPEQRTVQVALPTLKALTGTDYGILTAGTVLTLIPVWVVYTVLQKRMQQALVNGAVKM
ncbi:MULTISPECIES: carbohydrate ABC transporter permease [unclassified Streptomyces]|uniref:carbohydrate ABC transporter permease n=1 Tax=Streptomyces TaxID=1883 RepID=UPI0001C18B67|nr:MULTISPECIES: carbohydrate ABC transporter permease [unclassified Streptomyces]AEN13272.1 binding-protein-dependent transport systems inner membrane component [Streptomyces sp. SirexAA-E]MYR65283.1 ABC transporter permease subunit [Streptomyces sp. SID4939]MYS04845.1 ABC transporter permease subunit [Streptomyces sp. SID4940]MYT67278.1 ABC transporter permease subunit [Streptomyces sp. SID8357]MYT88036.1 ABC transporter permease subunit [Streptomyces sp. SID8360]